MKNKKQMLSYIGLVIVAMIWGSAFAVVKSTLDYVPPVYMIALRFTIAAIICMCIFPRKFTVNELKHGSLIGLFLFLAYVAQTIGCNYTTAGKNAFLTPLYIIIVPFIHWIMVKQRPRIKIFIAAIIAMVGIGFISLNGDKGINIGDILTIICSFLFAMQIALVDKYVEHDDPMSLTSMQLATCAIGGWILGPVIDGRFPSEVMNKGQVWFGILFLALLSTMLCQVLQTVCQKYTNPEPASLIMSSEALFGALSSMIFLHEVMSVKVIFGCVLMLIANVLSQVEFKKKNKTA